MSTPRSAAARPADPRRRRRMRVAALLACGLLTTTGCTLSSGAEQEAVPQPAATSAEPSPTPSGPVTVVYEVFGTGPADIEYFDAAGTLQQLERQGLPWRHSFTADGQARVMLIASQVLDYRGQFSCRASVTGRPPAEDTITAGAWRLTCAP
ncbi:MmpS family transport accessory protein [Micromonospora sp. NPDC002717]|uniref:MmpS family transport accessory protein n=1 Tax=Micromonospora sp. NPDC002717 TaxID=3154424 RepID=UPI003323F2C6